MFNISDSPLLALGLIQIWPIRTKIFLLFRTLDYHFTSPIYRTSSLVAGFIGVRLVPRRWLPCLVSRVSDLTFAWLHLLMSRLSCHTYPKFMPGRCKIGRTFDSRILYLTASCLVFVAVLTIPILSLNGQVYTCISFIVLRSLVIFSSRMKEDIMIYS